MSYNGSGTFNINSTGQPVVAGTVITASAFNALTADLATGLTTAITKDGQTTTTARITFAQGITSSLTTDSSSVSTGSIITAGGAGIAKNLYVGGIASFSAQPIFTSLTASSAVATDASKGLVSVTNTGTGNNVLATSPTITTPTISSFSSASATALTLQSAGTTAITIDTSQNVGIGTASPADKLHVAISSGSLGGIRVQNTNSGGQAALSYYNDAATQKADIWWNNSGSTLNLRTLSTDPMIFYTNNSERMRIDSSGNVGIGTSTINGRLNISGSPGNTSFQINAGGTLSGARRNWGISAEKYVAGALTIDVGASEGANPSVAVTTFDSSGKVTVGTSAQTKGNLNLYGPANTQLNLYLLKDAQVEAYMGFNSSDSNLYVNTGATFASTGVYMANGGTSWTTNSDERLKENLVPITDAITKVSSLRTVIGNFIADENKTARPFLIAQDVQAVLPEAISTSTMNETEYLGVSYTDVIPLLVASIKELKTINDTQAETINALTARIVALESK